MTGKRFNDVWDALEASAVQAENLRIRSKLMLSIRAVIAGWRTTQAAAAKRLGVSQPRLNDLLKGKIDKFSIDALVSLASAAGLKVTLKASRAA